jgi:hypothetical protein
MNISYLAQKQDSSATMQNIRAKGFLDSSPTTGCTYIQRPPENYQQLFQDLQKTLMELQLPFSYVRIPHITLMAAKVIDNKPSESWEETEKVQKIYQKFFIYHVQKKMAEGLDYVSATQDVIKAQEKSLAAIASKSTLQEALSILEPSVVHEITTNESSEDLDKIKEYALQSINNSSFEVKISGLELSSSGILIMLVTPNEKMLQLRLDLIIAGSAIAKWPNLSARKHAWSTVGYVTECLDSKAKEKLDEAISQWVSKNQKSLQDITVTFDSSTLCSLAFRSNDFFAVKNLSFPLASGKTSKNKPKIVLNDLSLSTKIKGRPITPMRGGRRIPPYVKESWSKPMEMEVLPMVIQAAV